MTADLHCHTTVSDGSMPPAGVVALAGALGLPCVAVTDHDCLEGGRQAAAAATPNVRVIDGVELSTFDRKNGKKVHLLCYRPQKTAGLEQLCRETLKSRQETTLRIIERVAARYPVNEAAVAACAPGSAALYKQHIAVALMQRGYTMSVFGELYKALFSRAGWAYIEPGYPETREALEVAAASGGVCVLAHPGVYDNFDIIDELAALGLDGIEAHHPRQSGEACRRAADAARRLGLITTGGSDFHGAYASRPTPLGMRTADGEELLALDKIFAARGCV